MSDDFIDKIKTHGYWRINFVPLGSPQNKSLSELKDLVRDNQVRLRGWYYPWFHEGTAAHYGIEAHNDFIRAWNDWEQYKEFWHLYKSGQFLHYDAVHEDWYESGSEIMGNTIEPGKYLNFVGSLTYYITEIVEFLTRLSKAGLYPDGARLIIELRNTKGRQLESFEGFRHLSFPKITDADIIKFEKNYSPEDLKTLPADLAMEPIHHFFDVFNFGDISDGVIKHDQETLYGYNGEQRG